MSAALNLPEVPPHAAAKGVWCRVTQNCHRRHELGQMHAVYHKTGKVLDVTMPLGEGEMVDWEDFLEVCYPEDHPDGGPTKVEPQMPVPGTGIVDARMSPEHQVRPAMSTDAERNALVIEAINSFDQKVDAFWGREGFATVKAVQEYIAKKNASGRPRWVTAVLIKRLTKGS